MSATATTEIETFTKGVLGDVSPFSVDFDATTTELKERKDGSKYQEYSVLIKSAKYTNRFRITGLSLKDYERLRILRFSGFKNFTWKAATQNENGKWVGKAIEGVNL